MADGELRGPTLAVLADHGGIGVGHIARCTAVIQEWVATGGTARFHSVSRLPGTWESRVQAAGASVVAAGPSGSDDADVWLLDGYRFDPDLQGALRGHALVAVIDDHGTIGRYDADVIIDQNLGAEARDYESSRGNPDLLLGTEYALLRREVVDARPRRALDRSGRPGCLLVGVGGQPTAAVRALVEPVIEEARRWALEVERLEDLDDVAGPLRHADVALSAAGSTCWELCAFGIPSLVVSVAANQRPIARRLGLAGAALDAGDITVVSSADLIGQLRFLCDDPTTRKRCSQVGRRLVDGRGAQRVVAALRSKLDVHRRFR